MTCCRNSCCCCREPCCWSGWLGCCKLQSCYWFDCCTCCCCRRKAALPDCCSYCLASADWASCYARWDARAEDCKLLLYNRPHCVALPGSRGEGRTARTGHWPALFWSVVASSGCCKSHRPTEDDPYPPPMLVLVPRYRPHCRPDASPTC